MKRRNFIGDLQWSDDELFRLCEIWERDQEKGKSEMPSDKAIDWDWERFQFQKGHPKNFK
jgi:hypothetical protein